eukprot:scaffold12307_cov53-Phaeocystis_antarctica.AAC.2
MACRYVLVRVWVCGEWSGGTWHVAAGRRVVRAGRLRCLRAQHGALRLVEPLCAGERRLDDRRVAQLGGEAEGGRQAVGARLARVGAVERRKGGRVASKAGDDEGRQDALLAIDRGAGRLQQQPARRVRIAEHALGDEGRVERRDVGARRHERREQLRVVAALGDDEGRVAVFVARVGIGLGVEEGEGGGRAVSHAGDD